MSVSIVRVKLVFKPYREKWQGGDIYNINFKVFPIQFVIVSTGLFRTIGIDSFNLSFVNDGQNTAQLVHPM